MRTLRAPAWAGLIIALFLSPSARAEGYDLQRFQPAERGSAWFVGESLDLRGTERPAVGVVLDYQHEPLVIHNGDGSFRTAVVSHALTTHVGGGFTVIDRLRFSLNVPVVLSTAGDPGLAAGVIYPAPKDATSLGDVRVAVDARLFGGHEDPITMAVGARAWFPTGSTESYTGTGTARLSPHLLVAGNVSVFTYAARAGVLVKTEDTTDLLYTASAGARVLDGRLTVGPEIFGSTDLKDAFKTRGSPLEALIGAHYGCACGMRWGLGAGTGIVSGFGAPDVRFLASFEWSAPVVEDADGDGIPDKEDACKTVRGVRSAEPAKNGCPLPPPKTDSDMDGIPDEQDACMDVPGARTNDPRTNGCADKDGDGILDPLDHCPNEPGPPNADPARNGCPDRDGDGIFDKEDACPDKPGPRTNEPETNGCPVNPDRDADGIPNEKDACPDEAGKPDANPARNGCPDVFVQNGFVRVRGKVQFKGTTAEILPNDAALEGILAFLKAHTEIPKIRVEGHTDNRGDAKKNLKLSKDRAAAVTAWLVAHGVDHDRLESEGYGGDRPIDENDSEEGRENNRRVELHIVTGK